MYDAMPRAFSFGELLDATFTLYRRNFVLLFGTALTTQIPLILFWLLVPALFGAAMPMDALENLSTVVAAPYSIFATVLMYAAVTHAAARAYAGEQATIGESLARGIRRWFAVGIAMLFTGALVVLGLVLLIVPGLIMLAMFFAATPVAVLEDRGPIAAMGRSRELSKGGRMRILGVLTVAWLITLLPSMALWIIAGVGAGAAVIAGGDSTALASGTSWLMSILQLAGSVVTALMTPFLLTAVLLLYQDRRARAEAPDLEAAAASL